MVPLVVGAPSPAAAAFPAEVFGVVIEGGDRVVSGGLPGVAGGELMALAAGGVAIVAEVVSRVFSRIGNMLGYQGVQAELGALSRSIVDGAARRVVLDPAAGEDGAAIDITSAVLMKILRVAHSGRKRLYA